MSLFLESSLRKFQGFFYQIIRKVFKLNEYTGNWQYIESPKNCEKYSYESLVVTVYDIIPINAYCGTDFGCIG